MEDREVRGDMIEVYKLLTGKKKINYMQFMNFTKAPYGLRWHEKKLAKDRSRLDTGTFLFSQRVISGRNGLAVNSFKNAYDRYYCKYYKQHKVISCLVHQPTKLQSWSKDKTKATTHITHCSHSVTLPVPVSLNLSHKNVTKNRTEKSPSVSNNRLH